MIYHYHRRYIFTYAFIYIIYSYAIAVFTFSAEHNDIHFSGSMIAFRLKRYIVVSKMPQNINAPGGALARMKRPLRSNQIYRILVHRQVQSGVK